MIQTQRPLAVTAHSESQAAALMEIVNERLRQDLKWGGDLSHLSDSGMLAVLVEEVGEAATAMLGNGAKHDLVEELVQIAAVCVKWLEAKAAGGGKQ